jgi:hypothetical protein
MISRRRVAARTSLGTTQQPTGVPGGRQLCRPRSIGLRGRLARVKTTARSERDIGRDDIVLQHQGRKAWVLNSSMGIWQITRQGLSHAHKLFLCDTREYSKLPVRLRPTDQLDMNFLSSHVLTTYAALLLRDLVDYFNGDVFLATGAYNGTKLHPNLQYASGVENVASYARRVFGNRRTPAAKALPAE